MKPCRIIILVLFALVSVSQADSPVWKVSKEGRVIYLGGTVHLLRKGDFPLPPEIDAVYQLCDEIYFELDLDDLDAKAFFVQLTQKAKLPKGKKLQDVLDEKTYQRLRTAMNKAGLRAAVFESMKPSFVSIMLMATELQKAGFIEQGVEDHVKKMAVKDKKEIGGLETVEEQIELLLFDEKEFGLQMTASTLDELDQVGERLDQLVNLWKKGDSAALTKLIDEQMKKPYPKVYDLFLTKRNKKWMPEILRMFQDADKEFVLVGHAHLLGEDGLVALLKKQGFEIEAVEAD